MMSNDVKKLLAITDSSTLEKLLAVDIEKIHRRKRLVPTVAELKCRTESNNISVARKRLVGLILNDVLS